MTLPAGTRLGPYVIDVLLGAGGMGQVYRGRDTRLDRSVAIKTVDGAFTERFEREARAISALNHPNICTLDDVGEHEGRGYLVMEYVEGAVPQGPAPILGTGNAGEAGESDQATKLLTGAHTILGTPQYMAPEQIEGKPVDGRTDIFAFGGVLYELLTGLKAFEGKTASGVMAAILATEPRPLRDLQPVTPAAVERVVLRCLAKDPDDRWQTARDLRANRHRVLSRDRKADSRSPRLQVDWVPNRCGDAAAPSSSIETADA